MALEALPATREACDSSLCGKNFAQYKVGYLPPPVTDHFEGWRPFPNPRGYSNVKRVHANLEGAFECAVIAYRPCVCSIQDRARAIILESHGLVVRFCELERKGAFASRTEPGVAFATARRAPRRCATSRPANTF